MALALRVSRQTLADEPEDIMGSGFGTLFSDDVLTSHGDTGDPLLYKSPHLPKPLLIDLAKYETSSDRELFSHHLWNAALQMAELIEADTLKVSMAVPRQLHTDISFDVSGLKTAEVGAGTALPSIIASLLGAREVIVTDYPSEALLSMLRINVARNTKSELSPVPNLSTPKESIVVGGHSWGEFDNELSKEHAKSVDRMVLADCLWMPWQHENLHKTVDHFLRHDDGGKARAWVCAGFHTGRRKMQSFFDADALRKHGLALDKIWERECDGAEREWDVSREDGSTDWKRWLVLATIKRI